MGLFTKSLTPAKAAASTMQIAAADYGWINNTLRPYVELEQSSLMPGQIEYIKIICAIFLRRISQVMPDDFDEYRDVYIRTILVHSQSLESLKSLADALEGNKFYDSLSTLMGLPIDTLVSAVPKIISDALPYNLSSDDHAILANFVATRLPKLAESLEAIRLKL